MSETKQATNFKYEWETNQIIKTDYIKRKGLYYPRLTYIKNTGDMKYCTEERKDIKCDVLIYTQGEEIKALREENEENEKKLIDEEQKHMWALGEIDRYKKENIELARDFIKKDKHIYGLKIELSSYKEQLKKCRTISNINKCPIIKGMGDKLADYKNILAAKDDELEDMREWHRLYLLMLKDAEKDFKNFKNEIKELKNKLEQTNKDLLNKSNDHKINNKMKNENKELSKALTKAYIEVEDLKQQIKTNKEYKDNFEKLQTQSGEQLKNVINDYEKDLRILRMRIKNQDNTQNIQAQRLKELANMKNQYSKYIDKYNRIDKYIDNTIYEITGIKRDFKKGIHNNINSFNQLRNIEEIIKRDFKITKSEFNNYFKNVKNLRLQQAHEDISHIGNKDLINMILEDMIF